MTTEQRPEAMGRRPVIVDTDIGIDDAMALLCLHGSSKVDLLGIHTVWGNAALEQVNRNALDVCEHFGIDAPVHVGAAAPLGPTLLVQAPVEVHGNNGLGSVVLPAATRSCAPTSAVEALIEQARAHPGELSVLALGPLSNLALALEACPELPTLLREVVVMGGVFGIEGQRGNVSPVAEANMAADPVAADRVLGSGLSLTLIGLDVTHRTILDEALLAQIVEHAGDAGVFIHDIAQCYLDFYSTVMGRRACPLHDASAAVCLLQPELFGFVRSAVRVVTEGIALGQTIAGSSEAAYMIDAWRNRAACRYAVRVDAEGVRRALLTCLRGLARGSEGQQA